ncbi:MAG: ABC transporter ATP-binding protein [Desulfuromonas sp.]|nr:ABC transporter ATP-binding protein [Desulfuromonas sp.]
MSSTRLLQATGLVKSYPSQTQPAVDHIDLQLMRGDLLGLLGPNGAGKTTTISMLATMLRPDSGTIEIAGIDALRKPQAVRAKIGVVPQDLALYQSLTLRENLIFWGQLYGLHGAALTQRIRECIHLVGLDDQLDSCINVFSGGMKRRANLAAGIIHRPELLFLDEPTVGIDPQSRHSIIENLRELNCQGMTMIYSSHYMEEVELLCSKVMIIDAGKAVVAGDSSQLLHRCNCDNLEQLFLHLTGKKLRD